VDEKLIAELERLCAAAPGVYFTDDAEASPYCGRIVRVWGDGTQHWAEGYTIVTEEPEADDHPEDRRRLVESANALPAMLSRLRALERVAAAAKEVVRAKEGVFDSTGNEVRDEVFTAVAVLDESLKEAGL